MPHFHAFSAAFHFPVLINSYMFLSFIRKGRAFWFSLCIIYPSSSLCRGKPWRCDSPEWIYFLGRFRMCNLVQKHFPRIDLTAADDGHIPAGLEIKSRTSRAQNEKGVKRICRYSKLSPPRFNEAAECCSKIDVSSRRRKRKRRGPAHAQTRERHFWMNLGFKNKYSEEQDNVYAYRKGTNKKRTKIQLT